MRNTSLVLLGGIMLASLPGAASAGVVFRDNFENVTGATAPFPETGVDANPVAQVGSWLIGEPGIENVQVSKDYSPPEGTQALVSNRNGTGPISLRANFSQPAPSAPVDSLTLSFKYRDPTPDSAFGGTVDVIELLGYDHTINSFSNQAFHLKIFKGWSADPTRVYVGFGGNGTLNSPDANSSADYFTSTNPDINWQQVDVDFDFVSHTYDFRLNGASAAFASNIPFNGDAASVNSIQQFLFYHLYSDNTRWALDDITVTTTAVPEPASLASLALAGLVLRRRR